MIIVIEFLLGIMYTIFLSVTLSKENGLVKINACNVLKLAFIGTYGFLFPICSLLTAMNYNTPSMQSYIRQFDFYEIVVYYLCISLVTIGFFGTLKHKEADLNIVETSNSNENDSDKKYAFAIALGMLIVGAIADYLYIRVYGSYSNYMNYSGAIRSGVISVRNPFSFLIVFRSCLSFSSFLFLTQIKRNNRIRFINLALFLISCFLSLRVLYSNRGRLGFVIYFAVIFAYILSKRSKGTGFSFSIKTIWKAIMIILLFVLALYLSGEILNRNISENIITQINKEISFIYSDFIVLIKNNGNAINRWFKDALLFPIYLLPTSIWRTRFGITTASSDLTLLASGFRKGEGGQYGEMPIDFISLSYMQLGLIGIFVIPIVYAILFAMAYKRASRIQDKNIRSVVYIYIILYIGLETIFYADPQHIIYRIFALFVFFIIDAIVSKIR
ncbi:MAG: O-antigen ligase [Ruminococcus sp.]|nr:O-antigen ligase [Ruminococcus sp.]